MTVATPDHLLGSQEPTHRLWVPDTKYSWGPETIELCAHVGLHLDEWQQNFLTDGMAVVDGRNPQGEEAEVWAAGDVGVELSRQNGKSAVFEARVLAGLFLLDEQLIVYSAHEGETAKKAFERLESLIRSNRDLFKLVVNDGRSSGFRRTNGQLSITLWSGQVVIFRTRTAGGGRGLSGDCVILDEAQDVNDDHIAALTPTLAARQNPQLWWGGSAGTRRSVVQGRMIAQASRGVPRLVYYRWVASDDDDPTSPLTWAKVNPALGRRIGLPFFETQLGKLSADNFGHEHLGIGDYPRQEGEDWVIPRLKVERATDPDSAMEGPVVFSVEVKHDRSRSAICVAGHRPDGRRHFETIAHAPGTAWTVRELKRLTAKHDNLGVVIDPRSPANNLVGPLEDEGISPYLLKSGEAAMAYGSMYDGMVGDPSDADFEPQILFRGGTVLVSAFADVSTRDVGGATTWRRTVAADVAPVLGSCWALYGLDALQETEEEAAPPQSVAADLDEAQPWSGINMGTVGF